MAYTENENSAGLDALASLDVSDLLLAGDVSDSNRLKKITLANLLLQLLASPQITGTANFDGNTASELLALDADKDLVSLDVAAYPSLTELTYVKGVTSAIQTQLNAKQASGSYATLTGTETLTNKRVTPRVGTVADAATITPTADSSDMYTVTALAQAATISAPSGTPTDGQKLIIRLLDNGTARALTWNAIYQVIGTTLPTTTVLSKYTYVGCIYNSASSKWDVVAVTTQA